MIPSRRRLFVTLAVPTIMALTTAAALAQSQPSTPRLSVNIPTIKLSDAIKSGGQIGVSWLPEYIIGLYNYGLTIGGVLAAVMMMWGGFQWMMGNPSGGKKKITNAATGLVILLSAYIILSVVSPTLVSFSSLNIQTVAKESLQILSNSQLSKVAGIGQILTAQEMNAKIKEQARVAGGDKFACFVMASVNKESGGRQGAVGHDENAISTDFEVGARKSFINSGLMYSGATFPAVNCQNRKCQNQGPLNDDTNIDLNSPPDYGIDWRYSHGFGAGQSTIFANSQPCPGKEDKGRGFRSGGLCLTVPELFIADNQIKIMLTHYKTVWAKTNDGADPAAGYVAYAGRIEKDNPIIVARVDAYNACSAALGGGASK
jgi:hypothetical protein